MSHGRARLGRARLGCARSTQGRLKVDLSPKKKRSSEPWARLGCARLFLFFSVFKKKGETKVEVEVDLEVDLEVRLREPKDRCVVRIGFRMSFVFTFFCFTEIKSKKEKIKAIGLAIGLAMTLFRVSSQLEN